jgi:hypothetical protein
LNKVNDMSKILTATALAMFLAGTTSAYAMSGFFVGAGCTNGVDEHGACYGPGHEGDFDEADGEGDGNDGNDGTDGTDGSDGTDGDSN